MTNKPKAIGTAGETAVAKVLVRSGWPNAERRALTGNHDCGDITGTPGLVFEVKSGKAAENASHAQILAWMEQELDVEVRNANAVHGVLVVKRRGVGHDNAGRWHAYLWADVLARLLTDDTIPSCADAFPVRMNLDDALTTLRLAGWGDPIDADAA